MTSLKDDLIKYLREDGDWIPKARITDDTMWFHTERGLRKRYMADTVSRTLRLAEEEKSIATKPDGKSCSYKWIPPQHRSRYIPTSSRLDNKLFI